MRLLVNFNCLMVGARLFLRYLLIGVGTLVLLGFAAPPILDSLERLFNPLAYELVVRLAIGVVAVMLILVGALRTLKKGQRAQDEVLLIMVASTLAIFLVLAFDRGHRLMEEFSWIRYSTSGFLGLAALGAWFSTRQTNFTNPTLASGDIIWTRRAWYVLTALFFYGAADEVLQIHELVGGVLVKFAHLPPFVTDLVTMSYALAGASLLIWSAKKFSRQLESVAPLALVLLVLGVLTFGLSTALDTFDVLLQAVLRWFAEYRTANQGLFSDRWYLIWAPKNFTNGFEEVLEQTAAALFFSASWCYFWRDRLVRSSAFFSEIGRRRLQVLIKAGTVLVLGALIIIALVAPPVNQPLARGEWRARLLGSARQGLFHADDLTLSKTFGVVVANEGGNSVLAWKDNRWRELVGAREGLNDPDSITADGEAVYISDSNDGIIFSYREKQGLVSEWSRADGLHHPEGLVVAEGAIFVLDESQKTITRLEKGKPARIWKPEHPLWQAPEGITYDFRTKTLLVTDDVSGALFRLEFEKKIELLARFSGPEDVTLASDGAILVTDNSEGAVYLFDADRISGHDGKAKLFRFHRPYLDLQGIVSSSDGRIFVISADGFGSSSWIPSMLWELHQY